MARTSARYERMAERFPMMLKELLRKGVTLQVDYQMTLTAASESSLKSAIPATLRAERSRVINW